MNRRHSGANTQQPRKDRASLKRAFRAHDPLAAQQLLAHSVASGHQRLGVRRYLAAKYLGCEDIDQFRAFCAKAIGCFQPHALLMSAATVAHELHVVADIHAALSDLTSAQAPVVLPYDGVSPELETSPRYCGARVSLVGKLTIGSHCWLGRGAVVRADGHFVSIGDDFRIGERSTVHISHGLYPTIAGDRLTVGSNAVIHGCTVGSDCVIEDGAIVLDGAIIEDGVVVEADATVFPRSILQRGWLYAGTPAQAVRLLDDGERQQRAQRLSAAIFESAIAVEPEAETLSTGQDSDCFLAVTATGQGAISVGAGSSVLFGCELHGCTSGIDIGQDCNIQDNCLIDAAMGPVRIGAETTLGHNVELKSCTIGSGSLIGIGSRVAAGTVIDDDVLLAGGAVTLPGQHLERGWLWGGRPARRLAPLDDAKRAMIAETVVQYGIYASQFRVSQQQLLSKEA